MAIEAFRYYTDWHDWMNRNRYAEPADPWNLIHVDPDALTEYMTVSLKWGLGRVRGGRWDRTGREVLAETKLYSGLEDRYADGEPWEETAYYEWGQEKLDGAESFRGCADIEEFVDRRCAALDELVADLRTEGYRSNYGRLYDSPSELDYITQMEPIALVDRNGDLLLTEGYHRVILGQLLGVESIPVHVLRRHEQWQRVRDAVHDDGVVTTDGVTRSHPDLQDVHPSADGTPPTRIDA
ncbi:hypothetical protein NGM10_09845 [Halorussus salilacus]|uniref:hypothetical protein n=1 Tax=Halorussus salilacus TaxID=2953750 RepID=UPI0020A0052F|nr:hypothetical protein [Halorussus salilacus]USZ67031.1 hypothetical protein NGM10_09845 [Halorussus salilacus]